MGVVETQERLDRAWAWVDAAEALWSTRIDAGRLDEGVFFVGDCTYVLIVLQEAGCRPQAVEVDSAGVSPAECLARAEAELDAIDPGQRPTLLLPARAELRALVVRVPAEDAPSVRRAGGI